MPHKWIWLVSVFLSVVSFTAQASNSVSAFTGTWKGRMNDQPAVEIRVTSAGGKINGTITFFPQRLGADGKWHVEGENQPQSLIDPNINGDTLTFEVVHHKTHGSSELGPNKKFRLQVTGTNQALFREAGKPDDAPGHGLKLVREVKR